MVVEHFTPATEQKLFSVYQAAPILGLSETALRAKIFRGLFSVVRIGRRTFVSKHEIDRLVDG